MVYIPALSTGEYGAPGKTYLNALCLSNSLPVSYIFENFEEIAFYLISQNGINIFLICYVILNQ